MRKTSKVTFLVLIFALLISTLIYTRPVTLARLCSGTDISQSESVRGYYFVAPNNGDTHFEIDKDSEQFGQLVGLFESYKFRKSIAGLLPWGTKTHRAQGGDFRWEAMFVFNDTVLSDGSTVSGTLISVNNFFGILEISFDGNVWRCTTNDKQKWLEDVLVLISE